MLYAVANWLVPYFSPANALTYITSRAMFAGATAFLLCLLLGPRFIATLRAVRAGAPLREAKDFALHDRHQAKEGTPTMGGLLMVGSIVAATLLWARLSNRLIWITLAGLCSLAVIGFVDDYLKLTRRSSGGLRARDKFAAQLVVGLGLGWYLFLYPVAPEVGAQLELPFVKDVFLPLGMGYIPFAMCVTVGTSNGVNLTDGLDGLAVGALVVAAGAYAGMAYLVGRSDFAGYLYVTHVNGASEMTVFAAALMGACFGFLWYNAHPAQLFMGDTGSLAVGGALGVLALVIKQELLLLVVGGLFVLESLSVVIQVASYRWRGGKRVFRMAPLHHHFELLGWSEMQVVIRFWIIAALCAFASLATLKLR